MKQEKVMKKLAGALALAGFVTLPMTAVAAGGDTGLYIAPKFVYSLAHMKDVSVEGTDDGGYHEMLGSKHDSTFGGSIAFGYDFSRKGGVPIRAEIEYAAFSSAEKKAQDSRGDYTWNINYRNRAQTLFLNAYYDFRNKSRVTPYVGAGVGVGFIKKRANYSESEGYTDSASSGTAKNFAWNLGLGLGVRVSERITIDAGYRYARLGKVNTAWSEWSDGSGEWRMRTKDMYQHQLGVGVRFNF